MVQSETSPIEFPEWVKDADVEREEFFVVQWCYSTVPLSQQYWEEPDPEELYYGSPNRCETLENAQERIKLLDAYHNRKKHTTDFRISQRIVITVNRVVT